MKRAMKYGMRLQAGMALILAMCMLVGMSCPALAQETAGPGDTGEDVVKLQMRLEELGWLEEGTYESGLYDDATRQAVTRFQQASGLFPTGWMDGKTRNMLFSGDAAVCIPEEKEVFREEVYTEELADVDMYVPLYTSSPTSIPVAPMYGSTVRAGNIQEWNTEEFAPYRESGFQSVAVSPLSTFAADIDTAAYSQIRSRILHGREVPAQLVRIEEMLNYFRYDYPMPEEDELFGVSLKLAPCPWNDETRLLQIGLQAQSVASQERVPHHLVFLIDTSGSMEGHDRLDLVKRAYQLLLEALDPEDTVSIVTYASHERVVLEEAKAADRARIMEAVEDLEAGGGTNGSAGIMRAYEIAEKYFLEGGVNRIILATDGDLNLGISEPGALADLVNEKKKHGVELTVLGFGYGNYKDNRLEALADFGNGNCWYIDSIHEARRALVTEADGTFRTVAGDVKLQVDFNPGFVRGYRLIGYEDRLMAPEAFADDAQDGGEIGSGHRVTVLYELVMTDSDFDFGSVESVYAKTVPADFSSMLTLNVRAKQPGSAESKLYTYELAADTVPEMDDNIRFAAAVAEVGMLLRDSPWKGTASYASALELLRSAHVTGDTEKEEFLYLTGLLAKNEQISGK